MNKKILQNLVRITADVQYEHEKQTRSYGIWHKSFFVAVRHLIHGMIVA
jgi:hypothetical protein